MDLDIEKLVNAACAGFDLKDFKGDIVGVKVVENEFGTIESGGIGIQNVYQCDTINGGEELFPCSEILPTGTASQTQKTCISC